MWRKSISHRRSSRRLIIPLTCLHSYGFAIADYTGRRTSYGMVIFSYIPHFSIAQCVPHTHSGPGVKRTHPILLAQLSISPNSPDRQIGSAILYLTWDLGNSFIPQPFESGRVAVSAKSNMAGFGSPRALLELIRFFMRVRHSSYSTPSTVDWEPCPGQPISAHLTVVMRFLYLRAHREHRSTRRGAVAYC